MEELGLDGIVDGPLDVDHVLEQLVEVKGGYLLTSKTLVEVLGGLMEDVAEEAVVDEFFFVVDSIFKVADVAVEEAELTAEVVADGSGADAA